MICPIMTPKTLIGCNDDPHSQTMFSQLCCESDCAWWDGQKKQCAILTLAQKPLKARINDINMEIEAATVTMEIPAKATGTGWPTEKM